VRGFVRLDGKFAGRCGLAVLGQLCFNAGRDRAERLPALEEFETHPAGQGHDTEIAARRNFARTCDCGRSDQPNGNKKPAKRDAVAGFPGNAPNCVAVYLVEAAGTEFRPLRLVW
jgi:hypothetical protein